MKKLAFFKIIMLCILIFCIDSLFAQKNLTCPFKIMQTHAEFPKSWVGKVQISSIPSCEYVKDQLNRWEVKPPDPWELVDGKDFVQTLPSDALLSIVYIPKTNQILIYRIDKN